MRLLSRLACLSVFAAALAVGCSKEGSTEQAKDQPTPMEKDKTTPGKDKPPSDKDAPNKVPQPPVPPKPQPPPK